MDTGADAVVVIAYDNRLIGSGLVLVLESALGVGCRAVSSCDPVAVSAALGSHTRALVLECPDPATAAAVSAAVSPLPVLDITGSVGGHDGPGEGESCEALTARLRVLTDPGRDVRSA